MTHVDSENIKALLAANLRRFRVARHLSLSEIARATSMSKATLSAIENGQGNPTVDTLVLLAGGLGVSISELLEQVQLGEVRIVRVSEVEERRSDGVAVRLLDSTTTSSGTVEVFELDLHARYLYKQAPRAAGSRQGVLVLKGKLIAGPVERISELASGDYASFPVDVPHVYEAGRTAVRAFVVAHTMPS
jgi:transcriptional regulator with XRE-family HTH domain